MILRSHEKLSLVVREMPEDVIDTFKDSYIFEFLNLSERHSESDLQKGLIQQMKNFILELGKDFLFVGEEYKTQLPDKKLLQQKLHELFERGG